MPARLYPRDRQATSDANPELMWQWGSRSALRPSDGSHSAASARAERGSDLTGHIRRRLTGEGRRPTPGADTDPSGACCCWQPQDQVQGLGTRQKTANKKGGREKRGGGCSGRVEADEAARAEVSGREPPVAADVDQHQDRLEPRLAIVSYIYLWPYIVMALCSYGTRTDSSRGSPSGPICSYGPM